ncbi:hypothetical protein GPECTOR_40g524 [Gonium pectorale]|uniref:cellulase n=1 Tax=Gonium pectorale TaxID=33097 RepID=A0A150GBQ2_GONPE|nr:hypothetical protein GPECTOR_40g524 [Gonium pectorale]|eukprot:KXZ46790.1 hypothetical protein GPECTOR_40g524 [Gonium pectorale]
MKCRERIGHLKSTFATAASVSLLAHAVLKWPTALPEAEYGNLLRNLDWAADYLLKCTRVGPKVLVAQVGDHYVEDSYWGAPEDQRTPRPVYLINATKCNDGADVVAQTVAALAGVALMRRRAGPTQDTARSDQLLDKAKELWAWGKDLESVWQPSEGNVTYFSRTYTDDKAWALAWLCKTDTELGVADKPYCRDAADLWHHVRLSEGYLGTDNAHAIAAALLRDLGAGDAAAFGNTLSGHYLKTWVRKPKPRCDLCRSAELCVTGGGFVLREGPGVSQFTANMALLALAAADHEGTSERDARDWRCWAKSQVDYLLGRNPNNQAFVTGLDLIPGYDGSITFPQSPRHRGSSCSVGGCAPPDTRNPNTLPGALVGGPARDDSYEDSRYNGPGAFVSIEFNAPLTGALLGLVAYEAQLKSLQKSWADLACGSAGYCSLTMRNDGILFLDMETAYRWSTEVNVTTTRGPFTLGFEEPNGVLTIKDNAGVALWHYHPPAGSSPQCLELLDDCTMRLLDAASNVVKVIAPVTTLARGNVLTSAVSSPLNQTTPNDRLQTFFNVHVLVLGWDGSLTLYQNYGFGSFYQTVKCSWPAAYADQATALAGAPYTLGFREPDGALVVRDKNGATTWTYPMPAGSAAPQSLVQKTTGHLQVLDAAGGVIATLCPAAPPPPSPRPPSPAPPLPSPFIGTTLCRGTVLRSGAFLNRLTAGYCSLTMRNDGILFLDMETAYRWSTETSFTTTRGPFTLGFEEPDGVLTIKDNAGVATWRYYAPAGTSAQCLQLLDDCTVRLLDASASAIAIIAPVSTLARGSVLTSATNSPLNITTPKDRLQTFFTFNSLALGWNGSLTLYNNYGFSGSQISRWSTPSAYADPVTALANAPYTLGFREPDGALIVRDKNGVNTWTYTMPDGNTDSPQSLVVQQNGYLQVLNATGGVIVTIFPPPPPPPSPPSPPQPPSPFPPGTVVCDPSADYAGACTQCDNTASIVDKNACKQCVKNVKAAGSTAFSNCLSCGTSGFSSNKDVQNKCLLDCVPQNVVAGKASNCWNVCENPALVASDLGRISECIGCVTSMGSAYVGICNSCIQTYLGVPTFRANCIQCAKDRVNVPSLISTCTTCTKGGTCGSWFGRRASRRASRR